MKPYNLYITNKDGISQWIELRTEEEAHDEIRDHKAQQSGYTYHIFKKIYAEG